MNLYQSKHNSWLKYANQTLDWYSTDSYENYQHNLKHKKDLLDLNNLTNLTISYKFNSEGFRCEEFTDKPSIMFLGSSVTQGIGLPNNLNYPNIVAKELKLECWNLAVQGKSLDTIFRIAYKFIGILKPKILVMDHAYVDRFELLDIDQTIDFMRDATYPEKFLRDYHKLYATTEENIFVNAIKNKLSIKQLCNEYNIKFMDIPSLRIPLSNGSSNSWARDLVHPGVKHHYNVATTILKKINE